MTTKPLTVEQIAALAGVGVDHVRLDMRRGHLPSQEPEVVREWLEPIFARRYREGQDQRRELRRA